MDQNQHLHHPDTHLAASKWSEDQKLYVAACYSNPFRWRTRRELANDFRRHMLHTSNVVLYLIELAYGDRPFDIVDPQRYPTDIGLRSSHELFHKENLLNLAVQRFPTDWKYGAIIDADFHFTRHDWALETIHQLQHHAFVQLFSQYTNVSGETQGTGHRVIWTGNSFAYNYVANGRQLLPGWDHEGFGDNPYDNYEAAMKPPPKFGKQRQPVGAPGGAWAFTRNAFDTVGGMLDKCILGSADQFMAFGLIGQEKHPDPTKNTVRYTDDYVDYIRAWQRRARTLNQNIGYVDQFAVHHFHGPQNLRAYGSRDKILVEHQYSPVHDVHYDWQGVLQLTDKKPKLRDEVRSYFLSRSEDLPHTPPEDRG